MSSATPSSTPDLPASVTTHIPTTALSASALSLAYTHLPLPIFNHSLRVFLLAKNIPKHPPAITTNYLNLPELDLLFIACIFHDMGICDFCNNKPQRFELEGADFAVAFLRSHHHFEEEKCKDVWTAIAIHTSPGIAERISPLSRLVRLAVLMDFGSEVQMNEFKAEGYIEEIESVLPRLGVEKCLGDVVVRQALERPEKAPKVSWPNALLEAYLRDPEFEGVSPAF